MNINLSIPIPDNYFDHPKFIMWNKDTYSVSSKNFVFHFCFGYKIPWTSYQFAYLLPRYSLFLNSYGVESKFEFERDTQRTEINFK